MNIFLIIASALSATAAILHVACIYFGASWYRFLGAGEYMATLAEQGSIEPTIITSSIAAVLVIWSLYAFSAAGVFFRLPFMRSVLCVITLIYLTRGIIGLFFINTPMGRSAEFWLWSSLICLIFAAFHYIGLKQQWTNIANMR